LTKVIEERRWMEQSNYRDTREVEVGKGRRRKKERGYMHRGTPAGPIRPSLQSPSSVCFHSSHTHTHTRARAHMNIRLCLFPSSGVQAFSEDPAFSLPLHSRLPPSLPAPAGSQARKGNVSLSLLLTLCMRECTRTALKGKEVPQQTEGIHPSIHPFKYVLPSPYLLSVLPRGREGGRSSYLCICCGKTGRKHAPSDPFPSLPMYACPLHSISSAGEQLLTHSLSGRKKGQTRRQSGQRKRSKEEKRRLHIQTHTYTGMDS